MPTEISILPIDHQMRSKRLFAKYALRIQSVGFLLPFATVRVAWHLDMRHWDFKGIQAMSAQYSVCDNWQDLQKAPLPALYSAASYHLLR